MLSRPLLSAWGYFENDPLQFCVWTNRKASCVQALLAHANCFRQYQDLFFSQGSVPAVTVAAAIHYTGVWQWCNDPAAKSLIGVPTVGLVGNHSSCLVVMQPQLNSVLTLQIVLLLQPQAFRFPEQLETSEFATCEVCFQKRLCFERNEWQKQDRLSLTQWTLLTPLLVMSTWSKLSLEKMSAILFTPSD